MFILVSRVTGCVSISAFASSVCVFAAVTSSAIGIKKFPITAGIKKYKSIREKKEKDRKKKKKENCRLSEIGCA